LKKKNLIKKKEGESDREDLAMSTTGFVDQFKKLEFFDMQTQKRSDYGQQDQQIKLVDFHRVAMTIPSTYGDYNS